MTARHRRRLSDADAMFLHVHEATGQPPAPVGVGIYEGPFDPELLDHLRAVQERMSPRRHQRIVRDRWSPALPRWVDVPDFCADAQMAELPPPGDGTLRAVIDWAEEHALDPFPDDRPPWRATTFHGVLVDGIPRTVSVGQSHHAMIDGEGGRRLGLRLVQFAPDEPLPAIPDEPEEPFEEIGPIARWLEGWQLELATFGGLLGRTARRGWWAARHPLAAGRRARAISADIRTLRSDLGHQAQSPLLRRASNRVQFDLCPVDLAALRAGAKAAGGTVNDGFLAAVAIGLHRWHRDHGLDIASVRTSMMVNRRAADDSSLGNDMIAAIVSLPIDDVADVAPLVRRCGEISRRHRSGGEGVRMMEVGRAIGARLPRRIIVPATRKNMAGIDVQMSNVPGLPHPHWVAGQRVIGGTSFPMGTLSGLALLLSGADPAACLSMTTDPAVVTDRDRLVRHLEDGFRAVADLAARVN